MLTGEPPRQWQLASLKDLTMQPNLKSFLISVAGTMIRCRVGLGFPSSDLYVDGFKITTRSPDPCPASSGSYTSCSKPSSFQCVTWYKTRRGNQQFLFSILIVHFTVSYCLSNPSHSFFTVFIRKLRQVDFPSSTHSLIVSFGNFHFKNNRTTLTLFQNEGSLSLVVSFGGGWNCTGRGRSFSFCHDFLRI